MQPPETDIRTLRALAKLMTVLGLVALAYVFVDSLTPDSRITSARHLDIDIADLAPGAIKKVESGTFPVWILYRTPEMIAQLQAAAPLLDDPQGDRSRQPQGITSPYRSLKPAVFVFTPRFEWTNKHSNWHGSLNAEYLPPSADAVRYAGKVRSWYGGFADAAGKGLYFDTAGRVYTYAEFGWLAEVNNLPVPPYHYVDDHTIRVELDERAIGLQ